MSIGPASGIGGSAAGAPMSQTNSKDVQQTQREAASQQRQVDTQQQAENAAGIGQTHEDSETSDRDADGRRLWERGTQQQDPSTTDEETPTAEKAEKKSIDPTGESGKQLDLTG